MRAASGALDARFGHTHHGHLPREKRSCVAGVQLKSEGGCPWSLAAGCFAMDFPRPEACAKCQAFGRQRGTGKRVITLQRQSFGFVNICSTVSWPGLSPFVGSWSASPHLPVRDSSSSVAMPQQFDHNSRRAREDFARFTPKKPSDRSRHWDASCHVVKQPFCFEQQNVGLELRISGQCLGSGRHLRRSMPALDTCNNDGLCVRQFAVKRFCGPIMMWKSNQTLP